MATLRAFLVQLITLPILGGLAQSDPFGGIVASLMQQLNSGAGNGGGSDSGAAIAQALGSLMQGANMQNANPAMSMNPGMMNPGMMNPGMMNPGMMNPGMMNPSLQGSSMDTRAADSILTKIMADSLIQLSRTAPYEPESPTIDGILRMIGTYFMGLFSSISPVNAPPEPESSPNDGSMNLLTNMMNMMSQMQSNQMRGGNMQMPGGNMQMPGNMPMLPGNMPMPPMNMPAGNQMAPSGSNNGQNTFLNNFKMPSPWEMILNPAAESRKSAETNQLTEIEELNEQSTSEANYNASEAPVDVYLVVD